MWCSADEETLTNMSVFGLPRSAFEQVRQPLAVGRVLGLAHHGFTRAAAGDAPCATQRVCMHGAALTMRAQSRGSAGGA